MAVGTVRLFEISPMEWRCASSERAYTFPMSEIERSSRLSPTLARENGAILDVSFEAVASCSNKKTITAIVVEADCSKLLYQIKSSLSSERIGLDLDWDSTLPLR